MALFERTPEIRANIVKLPDGTSVTRVTKNGKIIEEYPTEESQVRESRTSKLWTISDSNVDLTFKKNTRKM